MNYNDHEFKMAINQKLEKIVDNIKKSLEDMPKASDNREEIILEAAIHAAVEIVRKAIQDEIIY